MKLKGIIPQEVLQAKTLSGKIAALLFSKNATPALQFFRYFLVGGISFVVDTAVLLFVSVFTDISFLYVSAGFCVGVVVNYILSKLMVFQQPQDKPVVEFIVVFIISLVGLFLTNWLFDCFMALFKVMFSEYLSKLFAKIIAAAIVLIWNYSARKLFYRLIGKGSNQ